MKKTKNVDRQQDSVSGNGYDALEAIFATVLISHV